MMSKRMDSLDMKIGITGSEGFIGTAFRRYLTALGDIPVTCPRSAFERPDEMNEFCSSCKAVVHFAGLSRHPDGNHLLEPNLRLTAALICGLKKSSKQPHVFLASTTHEQRDLPYHLSKRRSRQMLETWAAETGGSFTTLLMPNTFGPYARPFFNSVVATFCYQAAHGQTPERIDPAELKLISVRTLCREIRRTVLRNEPGISAAEFPHEYEVRLDELWRKLKEWKSRMDAGKSPIAETPFEADLLAAFLSYCE